MSRWKSWAAFLFIGILGWGTSFMWIKIALREVGPFSMTMFRFSLGAASAWLLLKTVKEPLSVRGKNLVGTLILGLVNTAIPITMISWAENYIDSGLTALLNSTMPLWTIVIAHYFLHDDRLTVPKAAGLITGFLGIVVLVSRDLSPEGLQGSLWGQLAVMGAAIMYACSTVYTTRFLKGQHPVHTAAISLSSAAVVWIIITPFFEGITVPRLPLTWIAIAWMGIFGLSLAYYAYFYLLRTWGATRSSLVTYLNPVTAVTLGVVFLRERPSWHVFIGGGLVILGIALVNFRRKTETAATRFPGSREA